MGTSQEATICLCDERERTKEHKHGSTVAKFCPLPQYREKKCAIRARDTQEGSLENALSRCVLFW
jgi:hypothetical protein